MSYFDKEQYTKENFAEKLIADGLHMLSEYEGKKGYYALSMNLS